MNDFEPVMKKERGLPVRGSLPPLPRTSRRPEVEPCGQDGRAPFHAFQFQCQISPINMKGMFSLYLLVLGIAFFALSVLAENQTVNSRIGKLEFTHDFANGYPTEQTIEKLYDERDFQRACQAYLWAMPAVSFAQWQRGQASFGAGNGEIASLLSYDDRVGVLTPNATTPYYLVFADLSAGPFVIDMPPNVRGAISDAWQHALPNTNGSAKYLLVGPGQETPNDVAGFEVRHSPTFNINVGVRITVTDPKEAAALLAQLRAYPYAQRANPPAAKIVAPGDKKWSAMPPRGMDYWRRLDDVIQREPIDERDRPEQLRRCVRRDVQLVRARTIKPVA